MDTSNAPKLGGYSFWNYSLQGAGIPVTPFSAPQFNTQAQKLQNTHNTQHKNTSSLSLVADADNSSTVVTKAKKQKKNKGKKKGAGKKRK